MFTVRTVTQTDPQKPALIRDTNFDTKREALAFIGRLGELLSIKRIGRMYVATPNPRKKK